MNIFVSNLNLYTTEESLKDMFLAFGLVDSVKIVAEREIVNQYSFAVISMPFDVEAQAALIGINNIQIEGTTLSVSIANENRLHLNLLPRSNHFF